MMFFFLNFDFYGSSIFSIVILGITLNLFYKLGIPKFFNLSNGID